MSMILFSAVYLSVLSEEIGKEEEVSISAQIFIMNQKTPTIEKKKNPVSFWKKYRQFVAFSQRSLISVSWEKKILNMAYGI